MGAPSTSLFLSFLFFFVQLFEFVENKKTWILNLTGSCISGSVVGVQSLPVSSLDSTSEYSISLQNTLVDYFNNLCVPVSQSQRDTIEVSLLSLYKDHHTLILVITRNIPCEFLTVHRPLGWPHSCSHEECRLLEVQGVSESLSCTFDCGSHKALQENLIYVAIETNLIKIKRMVGEICKIYSYIQYL